LVINFFFYSKRNNTVLSKARRLTIQVRPEPPGAQGASVAAFSPQMPRELSYTSSAKANTVSTVFLSSYFIKWLT
jgi:hypothetical protein